MRKPPEFTNNGEPRIRQNIMDGGRYNHVESFLEAVSEWLSELH